jgi:hypothetical protein
MTHDEQDDGFETWLQRAARDHRQPPPTPRDAMWARIEAARAARPEDSAPLARRGDRHRWLRVGAGLAAALAIGVGIGRYSTGARAPGSPPPAVAGAPSGASAPSAPVRVASGLDTLAASPRGHAPLAGARPDVPTRRTDVRRGAPDRPGPGRRSVGAPAAYRLVAAEHLTQAESLLTSFRAETRTGRLEPQVATWARQLLATTRLLLDSPAADDPKLARLLGDLELVLAEIGRVPAGAAGAEIDIIDQSLERRDLVPRLKRAIPAGITPAGT